MHGTLGNHATSKTQNTGAVLRVLRGSQSQTRKSTGCQSKLAAACGANETPSQPHAKLSRCRPVHILNVAPEALASEALADPSPYCKAWQH